MINYIIQVLLFQALFILIYDLFLSKETFFKGNRWYLLGTVFLSLLLPLAKFSSIKESVATEYMIMLPEVVLSPQRVIEKSPWYESLSALNIFIYLGVSVFFLIFLMKLVKVMRLISRNRIEKRQGYTLVLLPGRSRAFSFFGYIFIGEKLEGEKREEIIEHELIHVKQNHSIDLLIFELLRIVLWFNPAIYLYHKRITLIHEYITDAEMSKVTNRPHYINSLLSEVFQVESISFINQFYKHSLIKKRIIMMTKEQSKKVKRLKYLLLLPALVGMIVYSSCIKAEAKNKLLNTISVKSNGGDKASDNLIVPVKAVKKQKERASKSKVNGIQDKKFKNVAKGTEVLENKVSENTVLNVIPFSVIHKAPTFPGCKEGDKKCLNKGMANFIKENFDMKVANNLGLTPGRKRIYAVFKIGKNGVVYDTQVRAPHPALKQYTFDVLKKLPEFVPGEDKDGNKVNVGYTLPITFYIEGVQEIPVKVEESFNNNYENSGIPLSQAHKSPTFVGCNDGDKKCLMEGMAQFVIDHFDIKLAKSLDLAPGKKRIYGVFKIGKNGVVYDINVRAPHPKLKEHTIEFLKKLPKLVPGEDKDGKKINIEYTLPITFEIKK
ncbi:energy transducer TonB [Tenacibaculum xiamenense]|uniref:energy transducer TonB n=1 Tax=Tenacibaculum xiamenense TaxID=1261553 RepID=UPI003893AE46